MKIAIVTSFPEKGTNKSGIAYFAKTVLDPVIDGSDEFVILADKDGDERTNTEQYAPNVTIRRCWKFGYFAPFQILREALRQKFDVLHLEYDVYLYGGVVAAVILPFVLRLIALLRGAKIVTTLHGVVSQRVVTREMLRENGFVLPYSRIGKAGFFTIYSLFNWASDRIIVLEIKLGEILEAEYGVPRRKLFVCPHPLMYECERPSLSEARRRCGIGDGRVALFFGYASYYKGLDVLLDAVKIARRELPDLQLHLVASRHPRLQGTERYEEFYGAFKAKTDAVGARLYDFVPEEQLADLLAASDVVVLPYTAAYGASGALNAVFAARRPVLVSHYVRFDGALDSQVFDPTPEDCARAIVNFFQTDEALLEARVEEIARLRNVGVIAGAMQDVRCGRMPVDLAASFSVPHELAEV
ncbi:MAG TPA: glycosyltransferase, partial [Candidatus Baltobacteraceae bacterium]|nr:glycosyltransferase [Candidatus Baltobacteraceae bacterium]